MSHLTIYEFDVLVAEDAGVTGLEDMHRVPANVFDWLGEQFLRAADAREATWLRWSQRRGRQVIQVTSFVGVIQAPSGYQIEVLPKVGKAIGGGHSQARQLLIEMLSCLNGFRHVVIDSANLSTARMPLLEIFISEFLKSVQHIVKRGLRGDYRQYQDNLFVLRGKLLISPHLRQNMFRADRFFTEHDEFTVDRPENRLLRAALKRVIDLSRFQVNQKLARELDFVFADIPPSIQPQVDFQQVRLDRGMNSYRLALAWARLILSEESTVTASGLHRTPSLLFPMETLFEAFVARYLPRQIRKSFTLKTQANSHYLVRHLDQNWFRLKPDLLIRDSSRDLLVLDTKWKLLNGLKANGTDKYGLSQSDLYQLQAYGLSYLNGVGDVVLIYPKTEAFAEPLPVFHFPKIDGMRLWVLPFCLKERRLSIPNDPELKSSFVNDTSETA